ncbi:hypothetical protein RI367_006693 [Sorochytrium milnesiophthora]
MPADPNYRRVFPANAATDNNIKPLVVLTRCENSFILTMTAPPDNRFNPDTSHAINAALDVVEQYALHEHPGSPCALITTSASPKFYSNGLDVMYLFQSGDTRFISDHFLALLKRMLTFPVITVAAINGHAFAGGLLLALAHDYRVMRADKGQVSLNEIDLPSSLHPGMSSLARAKLPPSTLHPLIFAAHRYPGLEALQAGIVQELAPEDQLLQCALKWSERGAGKVAKAGNIVRELKESTYEDVVKNLDRGGEIDVRKFMQVAGKRQKTKGSNSKL